MSGFLLDTNVVSELIAPRPDPKVLADVGSLEDVFLSVVTIHELTYGAARLPEGRRRAELTEFIEKTIAEFGDHVTPITEATSRAAAGLRAARERNGRPLHLGDALIAGTALAHSLTVVTRNVADFEGCGILIRNPWV